VILTGLFAGLVAAFSTAFYRMVQPVDNQPTEDETGTV
jgi:hypothetical protein